MVRIDLHGIRTQTSLDCWFEWLDQNIAPRTVTNQDPDEPLPSDVADHHFYTGGPGWQFHYVMTTLAPADCDRNLYECVFAAEERGPAELHYVAMYLEFESDAEAVMFKLIMNEI